MARVKRFTGAVTALALVALLGACGTPSRPPASGDTHATQVASLPPNAATVARATATPTQTAQPLQITKKGWGVDKTSGQIGWGFIVTNPNTAAAMSLSYQIAFYDPAGTVLETDTSSSPVLAAMATTGVAGSAYLKDKTATIGRMDVQVRAARLSQSSLPADLLTAQNVAYLADRFFPSVTGIVVSRATTDLNQVRVSVLTYGADGEINGGGFTFVDFVPANGQAAAKASVTSGTTPAKVEMYPAVSNLTNLGG